MAEREERSRHPEPGIAQQAAQESELTERQARRGIEGVRVKHTAQRDVHEEPLGGALGFGEAPVLQVGAHDACVVSAVPVMPGRSGDELEPESYRRRRWLPG